MTKNPNISILWFRRDLRLRDNLALSNALAGSDTVIPVFIWTPQEEQPWEPGAASKWWLHHSLSSLRRELRRLGSDLFFFRDRGAALTVLRRVLTLSGASAVYYNDLYEREIIGRDIEIKKKLNKSNIQVYSFKSDAFIEPGKLLNHSGLPYRVFTPFWKELLSQLTRESPEVNGALPGPTQMRIKDDLLKKMKEASCDLEDLELLPRVNWTAGLEESWNPGEKAGWELLESFAGASLQSYQEMRDIPGTSGTSRLSPYLHFGELTSAQVYSFLERNFRSKSQKAAVLPYLRQLGWREFGRHLLYHFPETDSQPLQPQFTKFVWDNDERLCKYWQKGQTGYPLVDAGMRELWHTGWMHNRVRMVVASFLVKHLLINWTYGARWFWDTLVDADLANNSLNWQWAAGSGADAQPFFRIFNPTTQGLKFDPDASYTKKWVQELQRVPAEDIFKPLISLRKQNKLHLFPPPYDNPVVEHEEARGKANARYQQMKLT